MAPVSLKEKYLNILKTRANLLSKLVAIRKDLTKEEHSEIVESEIKTRIQLAILAGRYYELMKQTGGLYSPKLIKTILKMDIKEVESIEELAELLSEYHQLEKETMRQVKNKYNIAVDMPGLIDMLAAETEKMKNVIESQTL